MASTPVPRIWTLGALLTWTTEFFSKKSIDEPRLSAELLLAHAIGCSRMALYTQYERIPTDSQLAAFRESVKQRSENVPVAYLIGKAWFFSLEFQVTRDVLIPRPDTETLVEHVIQRTRQTPGLEAPAILDLCTGSGCIAIALAKNLPAAQLVATDISEPALIIARKNAEAHKVADRVTFLAGDLFAPLETTAPVPPRRFHLIVANPPYIATADIPALEPTVRDHEPRGALDGGPDGLALHRRILAGAELYLHPAGLIALEIAYNQAEAAAQLFAETGYLDTPRVLKDAGGNPRCVIAAKTTQT